MTANRGSTVRLVLVSLLIMLTIGSERLSAEMPELGRDGWHTWRVAAADHAPEWCCFAWNRGRKTDEGCNLDTVRRGYGSNDDRMGGVDQAQLYVRLDNSDVVEIVALSPRCPVEASTDITDLGWVAAADSLRWLTALVDSEGELTGDAIAAISVHEEAVPSLIRVIGNRDLDMDTREEALLWLAINDSDAAMAFFEDLLL